MNDVFFYNWNELTRGCRLTARLVVQAMLLAVVAGFGPDLLLLLAGYGSEVYVYQFRFMLVAVPVVVAVSVISYRRHPVSDITTSSLLIDGDAVKVSRHVIAETGRRFFATWESVKVYGYKADEFHRVIQVDASWKVAAFRMRGRKVGSFVDSDFRSHPQTFQFTPEKFYDALEYLKGHCPDMVLEMAPEEYKKAEPFIHKHYKI